MCAERRGGRVGVIVKRENDRLTIHAPAKVNLHLETLGKRPDGYHEVETVMVTIGLYDTMVFRAADSGTVVQCDDPRLPCDSSNLVVRAVNLVRQETGLDLGIGIDLTKRIPMAAGLGGGSSDAASTLVALNLWWNLGWSRERLAELAAQLGSDVPFFLHAPAAIGRGRGERVTPCFMAMTLNLVVVCPPVGLSTRMVYEQLPRVESPVSLAPMVQALECGDAESVGKLLFNRLESVAVRLSPAVADLSERARLWPCLGHRMSGSGSAYFAICSSTELAQELGDALLPLDLGDVYVMSSP